MPILDFFPKEKPVNYLIQKDTDPGKYDAIAAKLCDKRIAIETEIAASVGTEHEELAIRLVDTKDAMRTFGITEIDYQAYLSQRESKNDTLTATKGEEPLPQATQTNTATQNTPSTEDIFHD